MAQKRIIKELNDLQKYPLSFGNIKVLNDNIFHWQAAILGPEDTPYSNGVFFLDINFNPSYPLKPPKITFKNKVYHCNINLNGNISLAILNDEWSPVITIHKILLSVRSLLADPDLTKPLVPEIADLYKNNRDLYNDNAKEWTKKYAA